MFLTEILVLGGSALVLGAMHALEPGHGKSIIAAYMAGNKGGFWHIGILGLSVSLSHTFSILILAFGLKMVLNQFSESEELNHTLELLSSLMIIAVGIYMIVRHLNSLKQTHDHTHSHDNSCCNHDHHLAEGHVVSKKESYRFMAVLGLSSGIIPCPTALAAFFSAGAGGNYALAFTNIVLYSIGIALTLMAIGLVTMYAGNGLDRYFENKTIRRYLPLISASFVLAIGFITLFGFFTHQH